MPTNKPYQTPENYTDRVMMLPDELKKHKAYVQWKLKPDPDGGKPGKIPYYTNGETRTGTQGSPRDRQQLATFSDAIKKFDAADYAGLGLAMLPESNLTAVDLDSIGKNGVDPELRKMVEDTTYSERSPGHDGVRAFYEGHYPQFKNFDRGIEIYDKTQFLTVTGDALNTMGVEPMAGMGA